MCYACIMGFSSGLRYNVMHVEQHTKKKGKKEVLLFVFKLKEEKKQCFLILNDCTCVSARE